MGGFCEETELVSATHFPDLRSFLQGKEQQGRKRDFLHVLHLLFKLQHQSHTGPWKLYVSTYGWTGGKHLTA